MNNNSISQNYFDVVRTSLQEIGYKDDNNTLALHILNVAHVVNTTVHLNPGRSPIYMAAIWLDNIVLNVISENVGLLSVVFMHDQDEKILYVVHHDFPIRFTPILYVNRHNLLEVWDSDIRAETNIDMLSIANTWFIDPGGRNVNTDQEVLHDGRHNELYSMDEQNQSADGRGDQPLLSFEQNRKHSRQL